MSSLEINFCSRFLRLSMFPWYWERLQVISVTLKKFQGYVDEWAIRETKYQIQTKSNQVIFFWFKK